MTVSIFKHIVIGFLVLHYLLLNSQSLVAYYPLGENANDLSGNNNNGTIIGGVIPATDRFGNPCGAYYFDGFTGYIEVPDSKSLRSPVNEFSVACWFTVDQNCAAGDLKWLTMICKGQDATETPSNPQYRVQSFQSSTQSTISINTDFTEYDNYFYNHAFNYNTWYFYALVYDSRSIKAFLNSDLIWEFPYSKTLVTNYDPLHIGKDIPGNLEYHCGSLDDLRIYSSALTENQILDLYNDNSGLTYEDEFILNCLNDTIVNTTPNSCHCIVDYNQPVFIINCGQPILKQISGLPSGSKFPVGKSLIAFEAVGSSGYKKTCYSSVIVVDKEPPAFECPEDTIIIVKDSLQNVRYNYKFPPVKDNCEIEKVDLINGLTSGSLFPMGKTELQFLATDKSGNKAICQYTVEIKPIRTVPAKSDIPTVIPPINQQDKIVTKPPDTLTVLEPKKPTIPAFIPDSINYEHHLESDSCNITLVMYDDIEQDLDTVSVYFNTMPIIDHELIKLKRNGAFINLIKLNEKDSNELVIRAWNIGKKYPNTFKIEIHEGNFINDTRKLETRRPEQIIVLRSEPGYAGAVILKCKK